MKHQTYLHFDKRKQFYECGMLIFLIIMSLYGFYKNGFSYVNMGKLPFLKSLKYLSYPMIGIILVALKNKIIDKKWNISCKNLSYGIILGLLVPPEFPIWLFLVVSMIYLIISEKIKKYVSSISIIAVYKSIIIVISHILKISLYNNIEANTPFLYGTIDTFFGRAVGSLGTTNIFLICLLYIFLATSFYYKKEIPIYIIASYILSSCCYSVFAKIPLSTTFLLNNSLCFGAVILFTDNQISPVSVHGKIGYGVMIGLLTFIFTKIGIEESIYIIVSLTSFLYGIVSKCFYNRILYEKNVKKCKIT